MSHQQIVFTDGYPAEGAQGSQDQCLEQLTIQESATAVDCRESLRKMRSVTVTQGQEATIRHTMRTPNGDPVDLSFCANAPVKLRLREALGSSGTIVEIDGAIVGATAGEVEVTLTEGAVALAGIVIGEFAVLDDGGKLRFSNLIYLVVNYGLFNAEAEAGRARRGAPTTAEIRLHLRDNDPSEQFLLDELEFDGSELAVCVLKPLDEWNETPPPVLTVNTMNFRWRSHWLDAIVGNLLLMAASHYMRNHLPYSAAGLSVDDKNKAAEYSREGQRRLAEWRRWMLTMKASLNANLGYGSVLSSYSRGYY